MAVTIHGSRTVSFAKLDGSTFDINLNPGDVYLTSPTSVMHGVSVPKLEEEVTYLAPYMASLVFGRIDTSSFLSGTFGGPST